MQRRKTSGRWIGHISHGERFGLGLGAASVNGERGTRGWARFVLVGD
jgi:hypothetical protein